MSAIDNSHHENKIKKAYDFISHINQDAYKDVFMLSNEVLSKNPFTNKFLERFLNNEKPKRQKFIDVCVNLLSYYLMSLVHFSIYLARFLEFRIVQYHFDHTAQKNGIVIIDTFFIMDAIKRNNTYTELFLPGLDKILEETGNSYAYIPTFQGSRRPFRLLPVLNVLKRKNIPVLCEYQLLNILDLLYIFYFILTYPFHVLKCAHGISGNSYETKLLKDELLATLNHITFFSFSRYLQGRRIAQMPYNSIKVISWYENQVIHKNFYRGLRSNDSSKNVIIYGAQLFLSSKNPYNTVPDENETIFRIVPDRIIANGEYFMPSCDKLDFRLGPSLRYRKLFAAVKNANVNKKYVLVLLPWEGKDVQYILSVLLQTDLKLHDVIIKPHPAIDVGRLRHLPASHKITTEDVYSLFNSTKIVIGAASGTLIEAASLGIPVISIKEEGRFHYDMLPEYGKGIIWEEAVTPQDIEKIINKFDVILDNSYDMVMHIAQEYKKRYFNEPTKKNIIQAFDLDMQTDFPAAGSDRFGRS